MSIATAARGPLLLSLALAAFAQTDSAEVTRLKAENAILAEQLIRATSAKSLAEASVPKITGGLEGKTTFTDDTPAEAVHLAYSSFTKIAEHMAKDIKNCGAEDRIMIFSAAEISALESLSAFRLQSSILNDYLVQALKVDSEVKRKEKNTEVKLYVLPVAGALAGPLIQSLIDITKLFRVDREISAKDITPDDKALIAILAGKLAGGCKVLYPELVPASLLKEIESGGSSSGTTGTASLSTWLKRVTEKTDEVRLRLVKRAADKVAEDQKIEQATSALEQLGELKKTIESLTEKAAVLKAKIGKASAKDKPALEKSLKATEAEIKEASDERAGFALGDAATTIKDLTDEVAKLKAELEKSNAQDKPALEKRLTEAEAKLEKAKDDGGKGARRQQQEALAQSREYRAGIVESIKILTAALEAGDAYRDALLKESGSGLTLLSRLIRSSRLEEQLSFNNSKGKSSILHVSVQKLTATTLKKTNAFTGTKYTYSGGAIATFLQFGMWEGTNSVDGAILSSGTYTGYSGQYKPGPEKPIDTIKPGKL